MNDDRREHAGVDDAAPKVWPWLTDDRAIRLSWFFAAVAVALRLEWITRLEALAVVAAGLSVPLVAATARRWRTTWTAGVDWRAAGLAAWFAAGVLVAAVFIGGAFLA